MVINYCQNCRHTVVLLLCGCSKWYHRQLGGTIRVIRTLSLLFFIRSLEQISIDADLPLGLVVQLVAHLIEWRKAIAIAPLSENNVYSTSQYAQEIM